MDDLQGNEMPPNTTPLEQQMADMRVSIAKMAEALTKLAILEERHQATLARLEKVEDRVTEVAKKTNDVEIAQIRHFATLNGGVSTIRVLWIAVGAVIATVVGKVITNFLHLG